VSNVCFRMFCQHCQEDGWHQPWCEEIGRSEVTDSGALPWLWTPAMSVVNPASPWDQTTLEGGSELFPQLESTGIVLSNMEVANHVEIDSKDEDVVEKLIDGKKTEWKVDGEKIESDELYQGGAYGGPRTPSEEGAAESTISWDLLDEMVKNNDSLAYDHMDKEKEELLDFVVESQGVVNNTPVEMATNASDSVDELWKTASNLAAALTRYVTKEGMKDPMMGGVPKESSTVEVASSSRSHCNDCKAEGACLGHTADSPASPDMGRDEGRE
jgi:hypothetical protein